MVRILTIIIFLACFSITSLGQKIKYKDLYVLLNAKQYEQAEPFLKKYLVENDDNPNACLYMGMIYHDKAGKIDVLKQTEILLTTIDSALIFYDKAYKTIDEKEIKRNDEYYQAFSRRDMRTGKIGITLSDVQVELENYQKGLKERKSNIQILRKHYDESQSKYGRANTQFSAIQNSYEDQREFFLQSDERLINSLKSISSTFDSCIVSFDNYKKTQSLLGKTGYSQIINLVSINNFKQDGVSKADFSLDDLKLWNYNEWVQRSIKKIQEEINPIRDQLVKFDIEINKLGEKQKKDSVLVKDEIVSLRERLSKNKLIIYDPHPLPMAVFEMKIVEIEYVADLIVNDALRDSANVHLHIELIQTELNTIHRLDSIVLRILTMDIEKESNNYKHFISNAYGNISVLKSLLKTTKDFASREKVRKDNEWENTMQALKWIITPTDSVPLFNEAGMNSKFNPIIIAENSHTAGLFYADTTAMGYFYTITPAHRLDVKTEFKVDTKIFGKRNLPVTKGLTTTGGKGQVYFVLLFSETKVKEKYPISIAKIYRTDGLAWNQPFQLEMKPSEMIYNPDSGELSLKTTSPSGESKMVIIDKNGKVIL